jgi:ABC-2 type transport system ATP-binding protein
MPPVIVVDDVSKRFRLRSDKSLKERLVNSRRGRDHAEEFWALRNVSFEVGEGTTVGLIGHNGSGKSTLLKTIGGIIAPTEGRVLRRGRLAALLELGAGFHPDLTGRENVFLNAAILGVSREETRRHFDAIVDFSGIEPFIDTQVKFYSSGMYVRLAFAVAVHVDPELLLVDEVLAVGDEAFQRKCMDRIKQFQRDGRTIVLVSHALDQVREVCDRAVLLEHGRVAVDGDPSDALRAMRAEFEVEREAEREAEAAAPESPAARAHPAVARVTLAQGGADRPLRPGDDLTVTVEVRPAEAAPCDDWVVGISVETTSGQLVYGTNTALIGAELPRLDRPRQVSIHLPDVPLPDGTYQVTAAVHPHTGPEYHRLVNAAAFAVRSDTREAGLIHLSPVVAVVEDDGP